MPFLVQLCLCSFADIEPYLSIYDPDGCVQIPSQKRLMVFLYHVCQGQDYESVGNAFRLEKSTVSKSVHDITSAIAHYMYNAYIQLPGRDDAMKSSQAWKSETGVLGIMGVIGSTHISVQTPKIPEAKICVNCSPFNCIRIQGIACNG